jgi:hypothetical protein
VNRTIAAITAAIGLPLAAQWIKHPTPGIPRTADGKPNLAAPAPRTPEGKPDLTGIWRMQAGAYGGNVAADLKPGEVLPWAAALRKQRMEDLSREHMAVLCLPFGPGYANAGGLVRIVQTPALIVLLYEDLTYRTIHLDGRTLERDPNPSWMGYSVGRWEGDTLVVESNGFNDRTWLDFSGHPHTEALRMTQRFRRTDFGHLTVEIAWDDPKVFTRPPKVSIHGEYAADTELLEYVCNENEKDKPHLVGKASDDRKYAVKVAPEILARYAGAYDFFAPELDLKMVLNVTLVDGELRFDVDGRDPQPLIPTSETTFLGVGTKIEFLRDGRGNVTDMQFEIVEGEFKAPRRR